MYRVVMICCCQRIAVIARTARGYDGTGDERGNPDPIETAKVPLTYLPPAFFLLPKRTQQHGLAMAWRVVDESRGRVAMPIRLAAVRTQLEASRR